MQVRDEEVDGRGVGLDLCAELAQAGASVEDQTTPLTGPDLDAGGVASEPDSPLARCGYRSATTPDSQLQRHLQASSGVDCQKRAIMPTTSVAEAYNGTAVTDRSRRSPSRPVIHSLPWAGRRSRRAIPAGIRSRGMGVPSTSSRTNCDVHPSAGIDPASAYVRPRICSAASL